MGYVCRVKVLALLKMIFIWVVVKTNVILISQLSWYHWAKFHFRQCEGLSPLSTLVLVEWPSQTKLKVQLAGLPEHWPSDSSWFELLGKMMCQWHLVQWQNESCNWYCLAMVERVWIPLSAKMTCAKNLFSLFVFAGWGAGNVRKADCIGGGPGGASAAALGGVGLWAPHPVLPRPAHWQGTAGWGQPSAVCCLHQQQPAAHQLWWRRQGKERTWWETFWFSSLFTSLLECEHSFWPISTSSFSDLCDPSKTVFYFLA